MGYRLVVLEDDSECSKVIDDFIVESWDDIFKFIVAKGYEERFFALYERTITDRHINDKLVGYYKFK